MGEVPGDQHVDAVDGRHGDVDRVLRVLDRDSTTLNDLLRQSLCPLVRIQDREVLDGV